jgi:hypothetical protein
MVVMHERVAVPSIWTVQAPHKPTPQPNFVPVMPSTSRSTQSRGVSLSTSAIWSVPLILIVKAIVASWFPTLTIAVARISSLRLGLGHPVRARRYCVP